MAKAQISLGRVHDLRSSVRNLRVFTAGIGEPDVLIVDGACVQILPGIEYGALDQVFIESNSCKALFYDATVVMGRCLSLSLSTTGFRDTLLRLGFFE